MLSERDVEVDDTDVKRDIRVLTDVGLMKFEESATWPVVVDTETQVDVRWEATSAVVPFGDGCGRPAGWLNAKSDCCEMVLDPEMSPIVSGRSAAVPAFLPTKSEEVCSLGVLAGDPCCGSPPGSFSWGSMLQQPPWQWLSQSQRECLFYRLLEANFQRFMKLGMAPWMRLVYRMMIVVMINSHQG